MGERYAKRVVGNSALEPGEQVVDACWGLGKGFLKLADMVDPGRRTFAPQAERVTSTGEGSEAAKIDRSGILALTDRRLLFFPVRTALGKPKALSAAWSHDQLAGAAFEKPMLTVAFSDGSIGGLYGPADKPDGFVEAVNAITG